MINFKSASTGNNMLKVKEGLAGSPATTDITIAVSVSTDCLLMTKRLLTTSPLQFSAAAVNSATLVYYGLKTAGIDRIVLGIASGKPTVTIAGVTKTG